MHCQDFIAPSWRAIWQRTWQMPCYPTGVSRQEVGDGVAADRVEWSVKAALAKREGVSPSYFTRLVRLSYLAPDITEAILDGRQPRDLTADKLLAHSRLPLDWHEQRAVLGFS
jgi:hypothetical protein